MVVEYYPLSKYEDKLYSKQGMPFLNRIIIASFKNTSFGHLMPSLSEKNHPSKTIVYLIQILQTDFKSPCNLMSPNPCIIPCCLS